MVHATILFSDLLVFCSFDGSGIESRRSKSAAGKISKSIDFLCGLCALCGSATLLELTDTFNAMLHALCPMPYAPCPMRLLPSPLAAAAGRGKPPLPGNQNRAGNKDR